MTDPKDVVTVERLIPAEAAAIFDLIAHPGRHQDIDGSGTVRAAKGAANGDRLVLGSTFGMAMKMAVPYAMANTVVEFEEDRRLAWQTRGPGRIGKLFGGRIWRYELEPVEGGTLVKESWDISQESPVTKPGVRMLGSKTAENMSATLARIEDVLTA